MIPKKRFILIILTLIVVSALLHRNYPIIGLVSTMVLLGVYVLVDIRKTIAYVKGFKQVSRNKQIKAITSIALAVVMLSAIFGGSIQYFFMLIILATDYMIYDSKTSN